MRFHRCFSNLNFLFWTITSRI